MLLVYVRPFGLLVGPAWTADLWSFVPLQTRPLQILAQAFFGIRNQSFLVSVLDPEQELTMSPLC
jgi:hypothetical protein